MKYKKRKPRFESKGTKKPSVESVFAKILEQTSDFSRKDIVKWRNALIAYQSSPESATLSPLQQIYRDLLMDGHLSSQILLRKSAILNTAYIALVGDEIDVEWTETFNKSEWVYELTDTILDTIFTGTTVIEFTEILDSEVHFEEIPKTHVLPKYKKIFMDANDSSKFIDYEEPEFENRLIQIGKDSHIGILNNIVPQLIWSRYAEQSWSEFCERFGLPMITATSTKNSASELSKLEKKIRGVGEGLTAVLPTGTSIDIQQPSNSDAYMVFERRINKCEDKISKQILAGTMITDSGSSRSQSEVHERNLDDKITLMDMRFNEFIWNNKIIPLLRNRGFKIPENFYLKLDISEKVDYTELIDFIVRLQDSYDIPIEWLEKTFGIPLKEKSRKTKVESKEENEQGLQTKDNNGKSKIESEKATALVSDISIEPHSDTCSICGGHKEIENHYTANANTLLSKLKKLFENYSSRLYKGRLKPKEQEALTELYQEIFGDGLHQHFDYGHPDFKTTDRQALKAMEKNIFKFSSAKTDYLTELLNKALYDGDKKQSWSAFKAIVDELNIEYNSHYLKAEYNHAVSVGQSSSAWFKLWKEREDIPFMEYQTIGDSKVREEHALLNGRVFRLDDKYAQKIFPPNGWNCRCEMLAFIGENPKLFNGEQAFKILRTTQRAKHDFLRNFALEKIVFTDKQMGNYGT